MSYDWTRFKKQVVINTDRNAVFDAWTMPGDITRWFIACADYTNAKQQRRNEREVIQAGDHYHWRWHQDLESQGTVLEDSFVQRPRFLSSIYNRHPCVGRDPLHILTEIQPFTVKPPLQPFPRPLV